MQIFLSSPPSLPKVFLKQLLNDKSFAVDSSMAEEKVSSELKRCFRRTLNHLHDRASSILALTVQWKDMEDHLDATHAAIEERAKELRSIEESLAEKSREIGRREVELGAILEFSERRIREVEEKEKRFAERVSEVWISQSELIMKERRREETPGGLNLKEKQVEDRSEERDLERRFAEVQSKEDKVEEQLKEIELKERQIREWHEEVELKSMKLEEEVRKQEEKMEKQSEELESKEKKLEERCKEVELMEKKLEGQCKEVKVKEKELEGHCREVELKEKKLEERCKEVELMEKKFAEQCKEVELMEKKHEGQCKEIELKEKKLEERRMEVELMEKKSEERCREVELIEKKLEGQCKEIELKEKKLEERRKEVELMEKKSEERCREVELMEKKLEGQCKEIELKEKKLEERCKEVELMEKKSEERCREVELIEKKLEGQYKEIELKEKKLEERCQEVEVKEKKFEGQCKEIELKEKKLEERFKEVELKEKKLEAHCREIELKENKMASALNTRVKSETLDDNFMDSSADASILFSVKMDGKALQIFLNERCEDHDSLRNEVAVALQLSLDPAKLILDAMEGFYPPCLKKGEVEFEEDVVRRSCILLLEQLMKISPKIRPHVKDAATKLAFDWMTKVRMDSEHPLKVLGFVLLLASYKLASAFDSNELLNHLETIAHHSQAPELFRALGVTDKISGFVQNLIRKKNIEAIRFIYAFELFHEFPPIPFLKDYLKDSETAAQNITELDKSAETLIETTNKRLVELSAVLRCVEDHKIEFEVSPKQLKDQICFLKNMISNAKSLLLVQGWKAQSPHLNEEKYIASKVDSAVASISAPKSAPTISSVRNSFAIASTSVPFSKTSLLQQTSIKRPWTAISAEDHPSSFAGATSGSLYLNGEKCFAPKVNAAGTSISEPKFASATSSVLISPAIASNASQSSSPQQTSIKRPRISLSAEDKSSALVGAASGASSFLLHLDKRIDSLSPMSRPLPKYTVGEFAKLLIGVDESSDSMVGEHFVDLQFVPEPAKHVLNIIKSCCSLGLEGGSYLKSGFSRKRCSLLFEQLRIFSPHIEPHVKEDALNFAADWKTFLLVKKRRRWEILFFVEFLTTYGLASSFSAEEALCFLRANLTPKDVCKSCHDLGLVDKLPGLIRSLIESNQRIEAIKYICVLKMDDKFPPGQILCDHVHHLQAETQKICHNPNSSIASQIAAMNKEISAMNVLLRFVRDRNLESEFSTITVSRRISKLKLLIKR